ncbi:hypothetical protein COU87_04330 [Candidatus Roizmanbacteria bacterium CG10_big_fil_rev_8_21_14_0_10_39_12]|uniref:Starch synthase catalytic domain-containing protein n=1 Tax=Candidatus Roizmanbacteria bacterium CG10_big_fil_rev_8_21_14_0_10_39_12 TaxID=1974852 RepID=A0A2M8KNJ4_9BACT|nr:MAG: hypothetical protein COU87_04330 [Candidatus Roizmanbacteria bacterium CG10_big_fil_rev_8_21_14_0_10_39_12]
MAHHKSLEYFAHLENSPTYHDLKTHPIVYMCAEYALSADLEIYAGGLGVLAADTMMEARDRNFPMIGLGLMYQTGYRNNLPTQIPGHMKPVFDKSGEPLVISIPVSDDVVSCKVWKWELNTAPIYFLDTRVPLNSPEHVEILDRLYADDKEKRMKQQMILGIGGRRLIEALGIEPTMYHLNEGHSAFLSIDLIAKEMKDKQISFGDACVEAKQKIVFTNHTLVMAGNEIYPIDLVSLIFKKYSLDSGIPNHEIVSLGQIPESKQFSMTELSFRMACRVNTVSQLHQKKAEEIWTHMKTIRITNGIHIPRWDYIHVRDNSMAEILAAHRVRKRILLELVKSVSGFEWSDEDLILGWARRIVPYKRPLSIFEDNKTFKEICDKSSCNVRFVFSGLPHLSDTEGVKLTETLKHFIETDLHGRAVYIPSYSIQSASQIISGSDVWLNTPIVGYEACGTSGMKAALNGVLQCSTRDGWIYEVNLNDIGWELEDTHVAESFYAVLENSIIPSFQDRKKVNGEWVQKMKASRTLIENEHSATRMLEEYGKELYLIPIRV